MHKKIQLTMNVWEWKTYKEVVKKRGLASIENEKSGFG